MDAEASRRITAPSRRLASGRTTVVISHNLLTVSEVDRIILSGSRQGWCLVVRRGVWGLPRLLRARQPRDVAEEHAIRKLAGARHAPADWIQRARMIVASWEGKSSPVIAAELGCHPQTVRQHLHRFNTDGVDGLGDRPGAGRKPRLTEAERSRLVALAATTPPGRLTRRASGGLAAERDAVPSQWTLDALTEAARAAGIVVGRSQVRRILLAEGVRWRKPRS